MLEGCDRTRGEAIELGLVDSDADAAELLIRRSRISRRKKLELIVRGDDKDVLLGLALNENLKLDSLQRVKERLRELDEGIGVRLGRPNYGEDSQDKGNLNSRMNSSVKRVKMGTSSDKKIDFIGRAVIELQTQT